MVVGFVGFVAFIGFVGFRVLGSGFGSSAFRVRIVELNPKKIAGSLENLAVHFFKSLFFYDFKI